MRAFIKAGWRIFADSGQFVVINGSAQEAGFSPDQRRRVFDGEVVWQEKASDSTDREHTVRMAFLLRKPTREAAEEDIFGFADLKIASEARHWSRIESPVTPEDFSLQELTAARAALAEIYLNVEARDTLNLSGDKIARFRALGSKSPVEWEALRETLHPPRSASPVFHLLWGRKRG